MRVVMVAGAGASLDQGLLLPPRVAIEAYEAGDWRPGGRNDRPAVIAHWQAALREALAQSQVEGSSRVVWLARRLRAAGHEVVVATTNVDGLLQREWPDTLELHGALRQGAPEVVLDGEPVPREREFRGILSEADVVIVLGLSDYTESLVDWIAVLPRSTEVWWVCADEVPDLREKSRGRIVFIQKTIADFVEDLPAAFTCHMGVGGPAGRTRSRTKAEQKSRR